MIVRAQRPLGICFGPVVCEMVNEDSQASFAIHFGLVWVFSWVFFVCMFVPLKLHRYKKKTVFHSAGGLLIMVKLAGNP